MLKLITDNDTLLLFMPQTLASVKGEPDFFERVELHLEGAERWLEGTFTGAAVLERAAKCETDNPLRIASTSVMTAEAMRRAIPSLDLVLTPNGFAVAQTQTLTPASKPRVDRLIASMVEVRDTAIGQLLDLLRADEAWLDTDQAATFGETLFPTLRWLGSMPGEQASLWQKYNALKPRIAEIEESFAQEWISPELMAELRRTSLAGRGSSAHQVVIAHLRRQVIEALAGRYSERRLQDIVNYIRRHPDDFPEWHSSATARLFDPPRFVNDKNAAGYFF